MQHRGQQEQLRSLDVLAVPGRARHHLHEVPVDGVPVHGGALRTVPHARPLGDPRGHHAGEVERLPHGDLGLARAQQREERRPRGPRPRLGQRRALGEARDRDRRERETCPGGRGGGAQRQQRVGRGVGVHREDELAVVLHEPVADGPQPRCRPAAADEDGTAGDRGALKGLAGAADRRVERVGDLAAGRGEAREQLVGVVEPGQRGDLVQVGQQEPARVPARDDLQGVAHVQQVRVRAVDRPVRAVREPRRGQGGEHDRVPDPAARLLEVGLDEVGELAGPLGTLARRGEQVGQAAPRRGAPVGEDRGGRAVHDERVACHRAHVEPAHGGGDVLGRHLAALRERAHRVVEVDPGVPERVPQALGDARHVVGRVAAAVVDEDEVEVARGSHVAPAEAAHRGERDPVGRDAVGRVAPQVLEGRRHEVDDGGPARDPAAAWTAHGPRDVEHPRTQVPHPVGVRDLRAVLSRPCRAPRRSPCDPARGRGVGVVGHPRVRRLTGRRGRARPCARGRRRPPGPSRPCRRRSCRSARP